MLIWSGYACTSINLHPILLTHFHRYHSNILRYSAEIQYDIDISTLYALNLAVKPILYCIEDFLLFPRYKLFFPTDKPVVPFVSDNKKPPKSEDLSGFSWSCYPDLNWGPHPYQAPLELFSNYFSCFMAISAPNYLLSVTLWAFCFHILHIALWLKLWSKTPPAFSWQACYWEKSGGIFYSWLPIL